MYPAVLFPNRAVVTHPRQETAPGAAADKDGRTAQGQLSPGTAHGGLAGKPQQELVAWMGDVSSEPFFLFLPRPLTGPSGHLRGVGKLQQNTGSS